jgi:hypothetical protein
MGGVNRDFFHQHGLRNQHTFLYPVEDALRRFDPCLGVMHIALVPDEFMVARMQQAGGVVRQVSLYAGDAHEQRVLLGVFEDLRRVGQYDEEMLAIGIMCWTGRNEQSRPPVRHKQAHSAAKSLSILRSCSILAASFFASAEVRPSALKMSTYSIGMDDPLGSVHSGQ